MIEECRHHHPHLLVTIGKTGGGKIFTVVGPTDRTTGGAVSNHMIGPISDPKIHGLSEYSVLIHLEVREVFDALSKRKEDCDSRSRDDGTAQKFEYQVQIQ